MKQGKQQHAMKKPKEANPPAKRMADMEKIAAKRVRQMKKGM